MQAGSQDFPGSVRASGADREPRRPRRNLPPRRVSLSVAADVPGRKAPGPVAERPRAGSGDSRSPVGSDDLEDLGLGEAFGGERVHDGEGHRSDGLKLEKHHGRSPEPASCHAST